jgi:hypothetical protein
MRDVDASQPRGCSLLERYPPQIGRSLFGLNHFGFGIQVECNLQEHFCETHIVAGAGHFPRLCRSVSEVIRVQSNLLF